MTKRVLAATLSALLLASPAWAATIPSVASGEARDREAALNSALRHAVEQVVGMSVGTTTYVSNLKTIEDRIYARASGYIEQYEVISEERLRDGGYRITVSAKVSKEKLSSAVSPLLGGGLVNLDGQLLLANLHLTLTSQRDTERALKGWLDELAGPALVFSFSTRPQITTSNPDQVTIYLDNFNARFDEGWYSRYRRFHATVAETPYAWEVFSHAGDYANSLEWGVLVADLYNAENEKLASRAVYGSRPVCSNGTGAKLFRPGPLPVIPPGLNNYSEKHIALRADLLRLVKQVRIRNPRYSDGKWPVKLD